MTRSCLLLAALLCSLCAHAEDWLPLSGIYAVTAESYLDPPEGEPPNTHYRIQLEGRAAADLYRAIPGAASPDECTGGMAKAAGELRCLYFDADGRYECAFSIDLVQQRIEYGIAC